MSLQSLRLEAWSDQHNTTFEIQVDPSRLRGARGLAGPALYIDYTVRSQGPLASHARLVSLSGWMGWRSEPEELLTLRIPFQTVRVNRMTMKIPMSDGQIEMIEATRGGGPVSLLLALTGLASIPVAVHQQSQGTKPFVVCETCEVGYDTGQHLPLDIGREQWLGVLEKLGAGKRRLVELPEPKSLRDQKRWAECIRLMDKATLQHRSGEHESALETCRKIVEGVASVLCERWGVQSADSFGKRIKELAGRLSDAWPEDPDAAALLSSLIGAAWSWASPAHHYGSKIPARDEATFAISLCADVLMLSASLIDAHPKPAP